MNNNFIDLFERLRYELSCDYGDDTKLTKVIDEIINYINKIIGKNFKINHVTKDEITKIKTDAFMFALTDTINYSTEMIRDMQKLLKNYKTKNYNPDYNDITYAMFLIDSIAHELNHCEQYIEQKNGILTEQIYLNSLCYALCHHKNIEYLDRTFEGEAFGYGVELMKRLLDEIISDNNSFYGKNYQKQMASWNFFKKNILFHEAVNYLDRIPFMKTKRGPNDIILYANYNLGLLNPKEINVLIKEYPLIIIGLEEENGKCRMKKPYELMEQYFGSYIKYEKNKYHINQEEKRELINIYVYLLMPLLTEEIYNDLCMKYGKDKMDSFMLSLKDNINKKKYIYNKSYQESLKRVKEISSKDNKILKHIDEEYAKNKYDASMIYMTEYAKRIDKFIYQQKIKRR